MPRKVKSFELALKYVNGVPPAGTDLAFYKDAQTGVRKINYIRSNDSNPQGFKEYFYRSFFDPTGTNVYVTQVSDRTLGRLNIIGGDGNLSTLLNLVDNVGSNALINIPKNDSAKAIVNRLSGNGTSEPSKITGLSYKKRTSASYTFPFGRKTGSIDGTNNNFSAIAQAIKLAANSSNTDDAVDIVVSFVPEKFRI